MEELVWRSAPALRKAIEDDEIRLPPPVSIAFQLISDWYRQQSGEDLAPLVRQAGSWRKRNS